MHECKLPLNKCISPNFSSLDPNFSSLDAELPPGNMNWGTFLPLVGNA
jgi:hypothetical protein